MKVLIWIGCIFVATILNTLLGELTGIKIGYLLFYFGVYFVARKLCEKWDEHKASKTKRNKQTTGAYANGNNASIASQVGIGSGINYSATAGWYCICGRVHPLYETSCVCGKSKHDNQLVQSQPSGATEVTNKIRFCRKCGEKLIDESSFCCKCGTQVVDKMVSTE